MKVEGRGKRRRGREEREKGKIVRENGNWSKKIINKKMIRRVRKRD